MGNTVDLSQFGVKTPDKKKDTNVVDLTSFGHEATPTETDNGEDTGFFHTLGNLASYVGDLVNPSPDAKPSAIQTAFSNPVQFAKYGWGVVNALSDNYDKAMTGARDFFLHDVNTASMYVNTAKALGMAGPVIQSTLQNPGSVPAGALKLMVETPLEMISGTTDVNGKAVPSTPEQEAAKVQSVIGTAVMAGVSGAMAKTLSPVAFGEDALAFTRKSLPGKLAERFGVSAISGAAGGAAYSTIADAGKENQGALMIGNSLAMLPIGGLFGMLHSPVKATLENAKNFLANRSAAQDIASIRDLQIDSKSDMHTILTNIDAISTSDNVMEAAIKAKLDVGSGIIVQGLTPEKANEVVARLTPAPNIAPDYTPAPEVQAVLNRSNINLSGAGGVGTKFIDAFDQAAFQARNAGTSKASKSANMIMTDLISQTGLSELDIKAHAKAVYEALKEQLRNRNFKQLSQPEIDQLNENIRQTGLSRLSTMGEGQTFKDNLGTTWTKVGNTITDGHNVIDNNLDAAKYIAGRQPRDLEPTAPYIELPKQNFSPATGRKPYEFNVYKSSKTGAIAITPNKFKPEIVDFFDKTGFFPNEAVVDPDGVTKIVSMGSKATKTVPNTADVNSVTNDELALVATDNEMTKPNMVSYYKQAIAEGKTWISGDLNPVTNERFKNLSDGATNKINDLKDKLEQVRQLKANGVSELDYNRNYRDNIFGSDARTSLADAESTLNSRIASTQKYLDFYTKQNIRYNGLQGTKNIEVDTPATDLTDVRRVGSSLDSKAYQGGVASGLLTPDTYFDRMYDLFKKKGWNMEDDQPFIDQFYKFTRDMGIDSKQDSQNLLAGFYKKIHEEIKGGLSEEEQKIVSSMEGARDNYNADLGHQLYNAAMTNEMYIVPDGGGVYHIKDITSGKTLASVNSFKEGFDFVQKSGQAKGYDLDGGDSGGIPPAAIGIAAKAPFNPYYGPMAKWWDALNVRVGKSFTPLQNFYQSVDGLYNTDISGKIIRPLQTGMQFMKHWMNNNMKGMETSYNAAVTFARKNGMTNEELSHTSDYIEAMSIPEITKGLLYRPMNKLEIAQAAKLKDNIDAVVDFMYKVRNAAGDKNVKSPEFGQIRNKIATSEQVSPEIQKLANPLFDNNGYSLDGFSTMAVLRLAKALAAPDQALSRSEFLARLNRDNPGVRTNLIQQLGNNLDDFYSHGGQAFNINPKAKINGYINHSKLAVASGYNQYAKSFIDPRFVNELTRMGYTSNDQLIRDPLILARRYALVGARTRPIVPGNILDPVKGDPKSLVSLNDIIRNSQNNLPDYISQIPSEHQNAIGNALSEHLNDIIGIPRNDVELANAARGQAKTLGINLRNAVIWTELAYQGAKPGASIRDFVNAQTNLWAMYGSKFATKSLEGLVSKEYVEALTKKGVLPQVKGIDLLQPGEDISIGMSRLSKLADIGLKLSGQTWMYTRVAAGVYKATMDLGSEVLSDLIRDKTTKTKAYDKLDIDMLPPELQKEFDNRVSAGKTEAASDLLARWRIKQALNVWGNFNNPQGWNGKVGRLLGQYGSWGANQIQSFGDALFRGSPKKRAMRAMKYAAAGVALQQAGSAVGLNLSSWVINPAGTLGIGPIASNAIDFGKSVALASNSDPRVAQRGKNDLANMLPISFKTDGSWGLNLSHQYIPFGLEAQNIINAFNMVGDNNNPLVAGAQAIGIPADKSQLQPQ